MKFTAVIDYSEPTSSNILFTEKSLTKAFADPQFMQQCATKQVPVYLDLENGDRMIIGLAEAKLEYPNVIINAEICDTEDSKKLFKKTMKNKSAGCALTSVGTRYYDVERDCSISAALTCTGIKLTPCCGVPCLMEIVKDVSEKKTSTADATTTDKTNE